MNTGCNCNGKCDAEKIEIIKDYRIKMVIIAIVFFIIGALYGFSFN